MRSCLKQEFVDYRRVFGIEWLAISDVLHDIWVGVELKEKVLVLCRERAQDETLGVQSYLAHGCRAKNARQN